MECVHPNPPFFSFAPLDGQFFPIYTVYGLSLDFLWFTCIFQESHSALYLILGVLFLFTFLFTSLFMCLLVYLLFFFPPRMFSPPPSPNVWVWPIEFTFSNTHEVTQRGNPIVFANLSFVIYLNHFLCLSAFTHHTNTFLRSPLPRR